MLSIVIVTYKVRDVVHDCLKTLPRTGVKIHVIDNASGDGTVELVRTEFPHVHLTALEENIGFAAANNLGIEQATGEFVLLLNPDTLVPEGALFACEDYLKAQPATVAGMTCRVVSPDGSLQWECARRCVTPRSEALRALFPRGHHDKIPDFDPSRAQAVPCILGAFFLVRRGVLTQLNGFDTGFFLMYEDVDLCKRIGDVGYVIHYWPQESIVHLGGQSWKQEKVATYAHTHASALYYLRKHFPESVRWVRAVVRLGLELKILLLSIKRGAWAAEHRAMVRAAREALR